MNIWTDGACSGNPGPGGWGFVTDEWETHYGFDPNTTSQRMEVLAIHKALEKVACMTWPSVTIYTDSQWALHAVEGTWKVKADLDLLLPARELLSQLRNTKQIALTWIRGHNGDIHNEKADALAKRGLKGESK